MAEAWRLKAKSRSQESKLLRMQIKRLKTSRAAWRQKCQTAIGLRTLKKVPGHPFPLELMWLGAVMHICCNVSLRATAQVLQKVAALYGQHIKAASASTIRNWTLRLGLYYLTDRIAPGRYALIADESISMGRERLLVLRVDEQSRIAPLEMSDARVLHIQSKASWGGADISAIIQQKTAGLGVELDYALSDRGTNLNKAFRLSGLQKVDDCTHLIANCTKKQYQNDQTLNDFVKKMNATRARWSLSTHLLHIPPALRKKARFHQVLVVHKWAEAILRDWDKLPPPVKKELEYVPQNRALVAELKQVHELAEKFFGIFKSKGVSEYTEQLWAKICKADYADILKDDSDKNRKLKQYLTTIDQYIAQTRSRFPEVGQLICCSDIIKSMFGKYKNKGGVDMITDDALKIAAYTRSVTIQDVQAALAEIHIKSIKDWKQKNTTVSMLALKRKMAPKKGIKNGSTLFPCF